jgi:phosphatidate cytidylyltransferase
MSQPAPPAPPAASGAAAKGPAGELRTRLLAALVLVPVLLAVVVVGREVFLAAVLLLAAVGAWELLTMAAHKPLPVRPLVGAGLAMALPALLYLGWSAPALVAFLTAALVAVAVLQLLTAGPREALASVSVTLFAALYVGLLFGHFVLVREMAGAFPGASYRAGAYLLAVPLLLTWANDTAAYVIGRRWGKRRLAPAISPGKSLEGALGALAVTVAVAVPLLWLVDRWVGGFGTADGLALGVLVGLAAPCGDLVESSFKRDAGVKDVSRLIPGHGGVLDRFDSLLFAVPVFYYYVREVVL